jgi:hypothetical protein
MQDERSSGTECEKSWGIGGHPDIFCRSFGGERTNFNNASSLPSDTSYGRVINGINKSTAFLFFLCFLFLFQI